MDKEFRIWFDSARQILIEVEFASLVDKNEVNFENKNLDEIQSYLDQLKSQAYSNIFYESEEPVYRLKRFFEWVHDNEKKGEKEFNNLADSIRIKKKRQFREDNPGQALTSQDSTVIEEYVEERLRSYDEYIGQLYYEAGNKLVEERDDTEYEKNFITEFEDRAKGPWREAVKRAQERLLPQVRDNLIALIQKEKAISKAALSDTLFLGLEKLETNVQPNLSLGINRIQSFIQCSLLGQITPPPVEFNDVAWKWVNNFETWQSAMKVNLYPENFIGPSLIKFSPSAQDVLDSLGSFTSYILLEKMLEIYQNRKERDIPYNIFQTIPFEDFVLIFGISQKAISYCKVFKDGSWEGWKTITGIEKTITYPKIRIHNNNLFIFSTSTNWENHENYYTLSYKVHEMNKKGDVYPNFKDWEVAYNKKLYNRNISPRNDIIIYQPDKTNPTENFFVFVYLPDQGIGAEKRVPFLRLRILNSDLEIQSEGELKDYPEYFFNNSHGRVDLETDWSGKKVLIKSLDLLELCYASKLVDAEVFKNRTRIEISSNRSLKGWFFHYPGIFPNKNCNEDLNELLLYQSSGDWETEEEYKSVIYQLNSSNKLIKHQEINNVEGFFLGRFFCDFYVIGLSNFEKREKIYQGISIAFEKQGYIPRKLINSYPDDINLENTLKDQLKAYNPFDYNLKYVIEYYLLLPTYLAQELNNQGRYDEANQVLDYVYNPTKSNDFYTIKFKNKNFFPDYFWSFYDSPFNPILIANFNFEKYYQNFIFQYVGNLLDWANQLFASNTQESINKARIYYEYAKSILESLQNSNPCCIEINLDTIYTSVIIKNTFENLGICGLLIPKNSIYKKLESQTEANLNKIQSNRALGGYFSSSSFTNIKYSFLLERSKYLTTLAQQLENSMLSSVEKEEEIKYSYLRAKQDLILERANIALQNLRLNEANNSIHLSESQKNKANFSFVRYENLLAKPISDLERKGLDNLWESIFKPSSTSHGWSIGTGGVGFSYGQSYSPSGILQTMANYALTKASFDRRKEEWEFQRDLADYNIDISDIGINLAKDHYNITQQEKVIAEIRYNLANDKLEFLNDKFTNRELYRWMHQNLRRLYHDQLNMAISTAKSAEQALEFERQTNLDFIGVDYWNYEKRGLLGAEKLLSDIEKMENYRLSTDERRKEIVKTISLSSLAPEAFYEFIETGVLNFETPMRWFDQDYPGHYMRLVRDVNVSIIALTNPNENIKATLSNTGISRVMTGPPFEKPAVIYRLPESVALSKAIAANGLFELRPQDPMLLPFEGNGVSTTWSLEMPKGANPFNYNSIVDVIFTIRYTAMEDRSYRDKVLESMGRDEEGYVTTSAVRYFSLRNEFPDQWFNFSNPFLSTNSTDYFDPTTAIWTSDTTIPLTPYSMVFDLTEADFVPNEERRKISKISLAVQLSNDQFIGDTRPLEFVLAHQPNPDRNTELKTENLVIDREIFESTSDFNRMSAYGYWALKMQNPNNEFDITKIEDILLIIEYEAKVHYPN
jgi:hypothetical protein